MTYLFFILAITLIISCFIFEKNIKEIYILKKIPKNKLYTIICFFSITFIGVISVYYKVGYPYFSEEKLNKEKVTLLKSIELEEKIVLNTKNNIISLKNKLLDKPNNIGLLLLLASYEAKIGNFNNEISTLEKILKIENNLSVQSLLAQAMLRKNKGLINLKIKKLVLEIIKKQPNEEGANYILGLYFKQIGETDKASKIWTKTLQRLKKDSTWSELIKKELIKLKN